MRTVYTTHFHFLLEDQDQAKLFSQVREEIESWVRGGVARRTGEKVEIPTNGKVSLAENVEVGVDFRGDPGRTAILVLSYAHPDDRHRGVRWETTCQVASHGGVMEFSLRLAAGESRYRVAPQDIHPGRPRIVPNLIRRFAGVIGGRPLSCEPKLVPAGDIEGFIENDLLAQERRLPIVVISPVTATGQMVTDPGRLSDYLAGLAEVWVIEDVATTYTLTDNLPPRMSVFDGGVRIYWPRMRLDDSPYHHPLYTRLKLTELETRGIDAVSVVAGRVFRASAGARSEGPVFRRARVMLLDEHTRQFKGAVQQARTVPELKSKLDEALAKLDEKDAIIAGQLERIEELERSFHEYARDLLAETSPEEELEAVPAVPKFETVEQAVRHAREELGDVLEVWDSAVDSTARSASKHASRVYDTLQVLHDVAVEYFRAKDRGESLGKDLGSIFAERGAPKYALKDSATTTSMYGEQRTFTQGDRTIQFERHFTLGIGSRENCVQIYFYFDDATKKVLVGYCGPHLDHSDRDT